MAALEKIRVSVLNDDDDFLDALTDGLKLAECLVITKYTRSVVGNEYDFFAFIERNRPQVMIFDISPPFEMYTKFIMSIRKRAEQYGVKIILTCTNATKLREIIGDNSIEICEKPFDLDRLTEAITRIASPQP